jgi:hypothetical protein
MKMHRLIMSLIFSTSVSNAAPLDGAMILEKGTPSPYRGVLMTETMSQQVYSDLKDYDRVKLLNVSLEKDIDFYKANEVDYLKEITELRDTNTSLSASLSHVESSSTWSKVLCFIGGMLATGLVFAYVEHQR